MWQADYQSRYAALEGTTVPLLRALADGSVTAASEGVRIRAAVESARMRRLFLQADGQLQLHPLAQEIQVLTELGEKTGYRWRWRYRKICAPSTQMFGRAFSRCPHRLSYLHGSTFGLW